MPLKYKILQLPHWLLLDKDRFPLKSALQPSALEIQNMTVLNNI